MIKKRLKVKTCENLLFWEQNRLRKLLNILYVVFRGQDLRHKEINKGLMEQKMVGDVFQELARFCDREREITEYNYFNNNNLR